MELNELSDADLLSISRGCTLDFGPEDDHSDQNCLACQAWAVWESREPSRVVH